MHNIDSKSQHNSKLMPQHTHQTYQCEAACDVLAICSFEARNLRFFLRISPNDAHTREIFLRPCRDLRKHGLNALKAFVNPPSEILNDNADYRQWQERVER